MVPDIPRRPACVRHLTTPTHPQLTSEWLMSHSLVFFGFFFECRLTGLRVEAQRREMKLQLLVVAALSCLIPPSQSEGVQQV